MISVSELNQHFADLAAPLFFLLAWLGYASWADGTARGLMRRVHEYREAWMLVMIERENRIVDTQIVTILVNNTAFFASASILIIGGAFAILGARDEAMAILMEVPFAVETPAWLWEMKVLLVIFVFIYAFFKFTWALRQFNYVAIMIGACPLPGTAEKGTMQAFANRTALVASRAAGHFNKAMRAYYFGLAALAWFVSSPALMAATAIVLLVNWRREFRSQSLALLGAPGEPVSGP